MTDAQEEVGAVLEAMFQAMRAGSREPADLTALVRCLDQLRQERSEELPPMLRHYLEKHSYAKALEFLAGQDQSTRPRCP